MSVEGDGMTAENDELRRCVYELDEKITEVVGKLDHVDRPGTNRLGMDARV